jgi:hypothetical protein
MGVRRINIQFLWSVGRAPDMLAVADRRWDWPQARSGLSHGPLAAGRPTVRIGRAWTSRSEGQMSL